MDIQDLDPQIHPFAGKFGMEVIFRKIEGDVCARAFLEADERHSEIGMNAPLALDLKRDILTLDAFKDLLALIPLIVDDGEIAFFDAALLLA